MKARYDIVGTKYRSDEEQRLALRLKSGDAVTLHRDPGNKHDWFAIGIYVRSPHRAEPACIGFIPRTQNRALAERMDGAGKMTIDGKFVADGFPGVEIEE